MEMEKLYDKIGKTHLTGEIQKGRTLDEMGVTSASITEVERWAKAMTKYGILATYIPELKKVDPNKTAIAVGDMHGSSVIIGDGVDVVPSVQSVIKVFLYLYALHKGLSPEKIADVEATAMPFNTDKVLRPELKLMTAEHPLNNAGGISSAGAIENFENFMIFMRKLTGNVQLEVLEGVFTSEMATNSNNKAIASRLVAGGRFRSPQEGERALQYYTRACSIGMNVTDTLNACLVLASGGVDPKNEDKRIVERNHTVRVMAAMNTFGMYEKSGKTTLLVSGARANTCKSGVGGLIVNVNPGVGAFVTYSPLLDTAGNSVFGSYAMIALNNLMADPGAMRLDSHETMRSINAYDKEERIKIHKEIISLVRRGESSHIFRADLETIEELEQNLDLQKSTLTKIKNVVRE